MKYTLIRIIPQDECPGTCCKRTGVFPEEGSQRCRYFDETLNGRRFGGCYLFQQDGSIDLRRYGDLTTEEQKRFDFSCRYWPVPSPVPQFGRTYDHNFRSEFAESADEHPPCECFAWKIEP